VHIYELVRQRLADTPRRSDIVTRYERINSDTRPDAKAILERIRGEFVAERYMLADDSYVEVTLELRALARFKTGDTRILARSRSSGKTGPIDTVFT
jgi:hypothetical protein